ncbi:hypothetical protein ADINL_0248 [Nitrincola lacisaponensis]|uniref:Polymerase beta nucleotidyltransferase domain-containing protein n=1 Tax=Nitrincola lacisaponensis TaxID=267850 RepID=A0A063Y7S2_9GAMM|nr:hypothetical protein [Nitrincola lacisaponensis]KDE41175.1 hypothetical protein ADINL_0248 [Nitrincola lacisaponensis]
MADNYRLTTDDEKCIRSELLEADPEGDIFLFGSRSDVSRRGGDVDIFFETRKKLSLKQKLLLEYRIRSKCDMAVDLLVKQVDEPDEIIHQIARKGIQL